MGEHEGRSRCSACGGEHDTSACDRRRGLDTIELGGSPPQLPADPLVGSMVGSFRVKQLLGRGGMGAVYLAEHPVIGSKVAIKFLHESMCGNPELVRRFYGEARAVNLIGHENIVAIYDLAQLPPARYYIVMEYLDGASLSALLRAGRVPTVTALEVLVQLAGALQAAHEHGVVHRDLKPENVFVLDRGGRPFVKLVDFGIAKLADRVSAHTAAGVIVGTPEYMAPEQCDNRPIDRRTDVYALGVMAYELATGRLPFEDASIPRLLLAQLRTPPRPPRELDPAISPELEAAILKAMAKAPDGRFQDMRAFAAALDAARTATMQRAAPRSAPAPAPAAAPAPQAARAPGPREVDVTVVARDGRPRVLHAREATRGGVFLRGGAPLPPLRSEVHLSLEGEGGRRVDVAGDVVRHVSAEDAARWNMPEGFAVAFHQLTPEQRGALDALAARLAEAPAATPAPARALTPAAFDELERRAASGPYEALGARPAAGFPEIRERARATRQLVDALRPVLSADAQASRIPALLARLDAALAQLGTPAERLMVDARLGNFQGVAHCVTAGVPAGVLSSRREAFLRANPDRAQRAQRHLARARVAEKLGNRAAALADYAEALRADPLDLAVHQLYWDLERAKR